jgi:hypothetical protein
MKSSIKTVALASLALALAVPAWSADESFVGKWKAEFDSQIGTQKYTFEFKLEDGKLTGKAIGERQIGTNEVKLVEFKTDKDEISFVEPLKIQDNEVRIEYKGKLKDGEIKLHRKVADIAEYDIVAKRVKETDAKAETKTEPKKPGTKTETVPPAKP